MSPGEKTVNEAAVMRFLAKSTIVPVTFVLHSDTKDMHDALGIQGISQRGIQPSDPIIDEGRFEKLYASWLVYWTKKRRVRWNDWCEEDGDGDEDFAVGP
ncbi:uncharacterized protein N7446_007674 [Penicillium canescens]|uniref:Uncharacterized protein n=1 Tax=Penicillium canescens TaxID=5083 RepID=A0AAD6ILY3_PENCN|nr:uncharacterized protein N7446_007674 [Penicillium canescens]KAJ6034029.1 hypothetical protein N7444_011800 [Penicillium canescens]KAJ6056783.1 hypothetical protein N7460_000057 [Penicillium canescens]KAJ6058091.1 hypothetical protein N7446_007674 [Penicillium canescens]